jgi:DNA-binding CsgD family transcriptional regulator
MNSFQDMQKAEQGGSYLFRLTEREKEFMRFSCTEMTYKEIALEMEVSPRTVDGYRDGLFGKLGVKSRVGLAIYAIRAGLVKIN